MAIINDKPNRLAIDALALGQNDRVLELGFGPGGPFAQMQRAHQAHSFGG